jgi:hypothetical protein
MRVAPIFNALVACVASSPRFGGLVNRNITMLTYTGRCSGRRFSIRVAYRSSGDDVVISVNMPRGGDA